MRQCLFAIAASPLCSPPVMGKLPNQNGTIGADFSAALAGCVTDGAPSTGCAVASGAPPPGLTLNLPPASFPARRARQAPTR